MLAFQLKNNLTKTEILPFIKKVFLRKCYFINGLGSFIFRLFFN